MINVLFDQSLDGPIAKFFIKRYKRKNISDMVDINICSKWNEIDLNRSEKDLIMTLQVCNRDFLYFYGTPIQDNWSNVTVEKFDSIGEEHGFVPIELPSNNKSLNTLHILHDEKYEELLVNILSNEEI